MYTIEVVASTVQSCLNAEAGGAGRIELCSALGAAGVTPSAGLIRACVDHLKIPVYVMIRPREGDFIYSQSEIDVIKRDIAIAKDNGAKGIVFGVLKDDRTIDHELTTSLVQLCAPLPVTFHRAFDLTPDMKQALELLIECGCTRVLSSGGRMSGAEGKDILHDLAEKADGRISIMPGGGLSPETITDVLHHKIHDYHLSGRVHITSVHQSSLFEMDYAETSTEKIREVKSKLSVFFG